MTYILELDEHKLSLIIYALRNVRSPDIDLDDDCRRLINEIQIITSTGQRINGTGTRFKNTSDELLRPAKTRRIKK